MTIQKALLTKFLVELNEIEAIKRKGHSSLRLTKFMKTALTPQFPAQTIAPHVDKSVSEHSGCTNN